MKETISGVISCYSTIDEANIVSMHMKGNPLAHVAPEKGKLAKMVSRRMLNAYAAFGEVNMTESIKDQIFKTALLEYLKTNTPKNTDELIKFLESGENLYSRNNNFGHVTGSSWILSHDLQSALLIHHKKYNLWVAPGGHVDEGEIPSESAAREAAEEVGIYGLISLSEEIFDLDIHRVPYSEKKNEPEHWHADVRYVFQAGQASQVDLNLEECNSYEWRKISDLLKDSDQQLRRMAEKSLSIINKR